MRKITLVTRDLRFYRWHYLAIVAGVIISTAVLTGALMVGDSVRGSLEMLTELRLGKIRWVMQPGDRFFRASLAGDLARLLERECVPALHLTGIGVNVATGDRVQDLQVYGVDSTFAGLWKRSSSPPGSEGVVISENLATELNLKPGDPLLVRLPKTGNTPQNAPFVANETPSASLRLTIRAIASEGEMGRFSLKSDQKAPYNAFVPLELLGRRVGLPGSANMLLVPGTEGDPLTGAHLDAAWARCWQLEDAGIRVVRLDGAGQFQITTDRIFFDDQTAGAILRTYPGVTPLFTYLANALSTRSAETPYSFVAAVGHGILPVTPGPGEILVTDWLAWDLGLRQGDSLFLTYYVMGPLRRLQEKQAGFTVSGIMAISDLPSAPEMMPDFPGLSEAGHCREWETGAPIDLDRIRPRDEAFWNRYKGTPKAFIALEDGKRLWANPFGTVTAFRCNAASIGSLPSPGESSSILASLDPRWFGFTFLPVLEEGRLAARNSTDFGGLFLSLSFFLIASALLLTALLFALHAHIRQTEAGVLSGLGFRKGEIRLLLLTEGLLVAIPGVVVGALAGILYNRLILAGLNTLWYDAVQTSMLVMVIELPTLAAGTTGGLILAMLVIWLTLMRQLRHPVSGLVKGTQSLPDLQGRAKRVHTGAGITLVSISLIGLLLLIFTSRMQDAGLFLAAGGGILGGGIWLMHGLLMPGWRKRKRSPATVIALALRLSSLHRGRTMAAIALLALGTFTVILTGANKRTYFGTEQDHRSGTGGFLIWCETTMPLLYDLNTPEGRSYFALDGEPVLDDVTFFQLHRVEGHDASCLNLNQVPRPIILGVPIREFDRLDAFTLVNTLPTVDPRHPWPALGRLLSTGVIPAFADQTVITWGLKRRVGDTLQVSGENGDTLAVVLAGGLDNSIFQGNLLISDSLLKQAWPSISGSHVVLVKGAAERQQEIRSRLEEIFVDYGLSAERASDRLAGFNAVEQTYLSVFLLLGALGVLIGTVGFGIIVWRNHLERAGELALYTAIGFSDKLILKLLVSEYGMILLTGMAIGVAGALAGILPSMISPAYRMPGGFLLGILAAIWFSGLFWIVFPARNLLRKDLVHVLRSE